MKGHVISKTAVVVGGARNGKRRLHIASSFLPSHVYLSFPSLSLFHFPLSPVQKTSVFHLICSSIFVSAWCVCVCVLESDRQRGCVCVIEGERISAFRFRNSLFSILFLSLFVDFSVSLIHKDTHPNKHTPLHS